MESLGVRQNSTPISRGFPFGVPLDQPEKGSLKRGATHMMHNAKTLTEDTPKQPIARRRGPTFLGM